MMTELTAGRHTVRGASLGGMYTSLYVSELDALFDVGVPVRAAVGARNLFLSHAHIDHLGALPSFIGMRGLCGVREPLRVFHPAGLEGHLREALAALSAMHRWPLEIECVPMTDGDTFQLRRDLTVRAFRTWHPVPSLGFLFYEQVKKLRAEFSELPGAEIGERRRRGEDLFETKSHLEFAYATDTLPRVLESTPELADVRTLVLECTFLDERKSIEAARAGCHIHFDELRPRLRDMNNEALVLMHFSQLYKPAEVKHLLELRAPRGSGPPILPFLPDGPAWWI